MDNRPQQPTVLAVEISYLRRVCGVTWDGEKVENIHGRCGMGTHTNAVMLIDGMDETKYIEVVWTY